MGSEQADYKSWSNDELVARVTQLEAELKSKNERYMQPERILL
jgi:hypothetical protein